MTDFWAVMADRLPYFLPVLAAGAVMTVKVTVGALGFALAAGLVVALMRISRLRLLRVVSTAYVELFRGTPALVQLFIIYFGLSDLGIDIAPVPAAIVGLGMNGAAYLSEVYRAGIQEIHKGQMEAALSLGMTPARAMQDIILPQAVRLMLPPISNFSIVLLKDTSLVSSIAAPEIMFYARNLRTETFLSMHIYLIVAVLYLAMTLPMSRVVARLERARKAWH
ncbi:MAG TPA: amino acid ABC transporter permease [Dongiaceae bacterium]|nr:amino acid ABC transporter permease [Dongiaceae bacterium]